MLGPFLWSPAENAIPLYFECHTCVSCFNFQDKAKLKTRKRSEPIEPGVIGNMVRYARKSIREFRAFKNIKHILHCYLIPLIINTPVSKSIWLHNDWPFKLMQPWPLQHHLVSYWRCVSRAWRRWEPSSMNPMFTCFTWCTRLWGFVSTCKIPTEPLDMARKSSSLTGVMKCCI